MKITELLSDDGAVSPVIGVILMVAITVILAAVIGTFVLNLGGNLSQTSPQASFGFDFDENSTSDDYVAITHETGDTIEADRLALKTSTAVDVQTSPSGWEASTSESNNFTDPSAGSFQSGSSVGAGDTLYAGGAGDNLEGTSFSVVWNSENDETSATLSKWTAPDN